MQQRWQPEKDIHYISALRAVLIAGLFPSSIPDVGFNMRPGYLRNYLSPVTSTCPIRFGRKGVLQVPSAKNFHLTRNPEAGLFCHGTHPW